MSLSQSSPGIRALTSGEGGGEEKVGGGGWGAGLTMDPRCQYGATRDLVGI